MANLGEANANVGGKAKRKNTEGMNVAIGELFVVLGFMSDRT
jgi:hypothetical protein